MKYSQGEEEKYILQAVGEAPGRFLDIGAWQPKDLSNTRALYEKGWSGLMIEPSPQPFLDLLREYGNDPKITLLCGAVGLTRAITKFHATADALSTSDALNYERWKETGGFYGAFHTSVVPLDEILNQFGAFDFVSIDAEGNSVDIFLALLATEMLPRCICVEYDLRAAEVFQAASRKGYAALYTSAENVVFGR